MASSTAHLATERQRTLRQTGSRRAVARVKGTVAGVVLIVGTAVGIIVAVISAWWLGVGACITVSLGLWCGVVRRRIATAEDRALRSIGPAREADPRTDARLLNLVDGLVPSAGLQRPRCLVSHDPARNAVCVGRDARHGCLVVTTGLLEAMTRMELEAVVAHALVTIRDGTVAGATLALAIGGERLLGVAGAPAMRAETDLAAVMLTRYPPGLAGALRTVLDGGPPAAVAGASRCADGLWLAEPGDEDGLRGRAEVLEEL